MSQVIDFLRRRKKRKVSAFLPTEDQSPPEVYEGPVRDGDATERYRQLDNEASKRKANKDRDLNQDEERRRSQ